MIQKTVARLKGISEPDDIFIVTNKMYADLVAEQLPDIPKENVLLEPCGRNTAPCIALAAAVIQNKYGEESIMLVLPSDHLIRYEEMYADTLRQAISVAQSGQRLVTIGITPTYPETGYGYIQFERDTTLGMRGVYQVSRFVEKPDIDTAKIYLASRKYLWNSGMFVWRTDTILANMEKFMPEVFAGVSEIAATFGTDEFDAALEEGYEKLPANQWTSALWKRLRKYTLFREASAGTTSETGWLLSE